MKTYQIVLKSILCNFFKFVGHEDKYYRTMELMKERTSYAYRMQVELLTCPPTQHYNSAQKFATPSQCNKVPQYNTPCVYNQGNKGGFIRGGCGINHKRRMWNMRIWKR